VDRFFVDFMLPKHKIAVEVDGQYWHQNKRRDIKRQRIIEKKGYTVVRFNDSQIMNSPSSVRDEMSRIVMNHEKRYQTMSMVVESIKHWTLNRPRTLYNIAVDEDESYIAKGFVVHNCRCAWVPYVKTRK